MSCEHVHKDAPENSYCEDCKPKNQSPQDKSEELHAANAVDEGSERPEDTEPEEAQLAISGVAESGSHDIPVETSAKKLEGNRVPSSDTLSDKIKDFHCDVCLNVCDIQVKDVKEAVKRLKHDLKHGMKGATHLSEPVLIKNEWAIIDRIFGSKLT